MNTPISKKQDGFTLLELVVVVAVLGLIANLATEFVAQNTNQERFEATKARQAMIREAILGNPSATQNGEVQVSGFIADMGFAPKHLRQLLTNEGYCPNPDHFDIEDDPNDASDDPETDCNLLNGGDITLNWIPALNESWKGPYIYGFELESKSYKSRATNFRTFRDAWGNNSTAWSGTSDSDNEKALEDFLNFGWNYYITSNDIYLLSAGLDGTADPEDSNTPSTATETNKTNYEKLSIYEQDYPATTYSGSSAPYSLEYNALVLNKEYAALSYSPISIDIQNTTLSNSNNLCVRVWRANDTGKTDVYKPVSENSFVVSAATTEPTIENVLIKVSGINIDDDDPKLVESAHGVYYIDAVEATDCNLITDNSPSVCQETLQPVLITNRTSSISVTCQLL